MNFELQPIPQEDEPTTEELPFEIEDIEDSPEMREYLLDKYGLDANASPDELTARIDAEAIAKQAVAIGLPENATHDEVITEKRRLGISDMGYLLGLGLPVDASPDQIKAAEERQWQERRSVLYEVAERMRANAARNVTPKNRIGNSPESEEN